MQLSRIPYGNDFDIRITIVQPQYTVEGTIWEDFDLTVCSNIKVALVCEKHRVVIPLNWHIEENTNNIIIANVIAKQLHIGTIYGVEVTGLDANGRAWRFKNADVFSVVDQTKNSLMNAEIMSDPLEINADIGLAINVTPIPVTGPQGPQGVQGPIGVQGPQGELGPQGPQGPQGDIGDRGIGVTSVGYIGSSGLLKHYGMNYGDGEFFDWWVSDGVEGQPGPQGPQGEKGQDGSVSFDDLTPEQRESLRGPQGEQGPQGEVGATGPQGEVGATGPQGAPLTFDDLTQQQKDQLRGEDGPIGPQGDKGDKGANGDKGDKGEQGSIGLTGPQGERGPQGETGATGPQGADGTVTFEELTPEQKEELRGPVGPQGNQGETGPQGPQGDKGQDGTVTFDDLTPEQRESLRGPQGVQGSIGNAFVYSDFTPEQLAALTGPQGNQGEQGATGPQGAQGSKGDAFEYSDFTPEQLAALTGPQGNQGEQGAQGPQGETGTTGPQGNQGEQGATGPQGADGSVSFDDLTPSQKEQLKGDTGPQGAQGSKGDAFVYSDFTPDQLAALTGPQGNQGAAGQDGQAGVQGPQGDQGPQGNQGAAGQDGQTGPQGPQGDQGPQGNQGAAGQDGQTGPQGPQGDQGPQGAGIDSLDKYAIDTIYDEPNSRLYIYLRTASPDGTIYQPNTLTLSYPNQYADIRTNKNLSYIVYINGTMVNTNTFNNAVQKTGRDTYLSLPATIGNITVDKNSIIQFRINRLSPYNSDPHDIINVVLDSKYNVIGNTLGLKIEVVSAMPASPDSNTLYVIV